MIENIKQYKLFQNQSIKLFKPLENQGYCNINYLLATEEKRYLIRKFKLKNDRESEFKVQKITYRGGVGAKPIILDIENSVMICEFIDGVHKKRLDKKSIRKLSLLIRKLHKIKIGQKSVSLKKSFSFRDKKVPSAFREIQRYKRELVLCHNDLHPKNIIFSNSIKLIDWEYAGINDRYFDLASILIEFNLSRVDEKLFFRVYFERNSKANLKKLTAYKIIYRELSRVWFEKLNRGKLY